MLELDKIYHGDAFELLSQVEDGAVDLVVPWGGREAEIRLGTTIPTAPAVHQAIKSIPGVVHVEEV